MSNENTEGQEALQESGAATESQEQPQGTNGAQVPTWKYADGIAGDGVAPDWFLSDKYNSVSEQAKAAHELRKKLGSKAEDAPEHYELDFEKYGIDKEDAVLAEFNPFFKELNIPQKDYEKIIEKFVEIQTKNHETANKQREEAFNAFGPETKEVVGRLNVWADNKFNAQEKEVIKGFMETEDGVRVLEKMRSGAPRSAPPTAHQVPSQSLYETVASINKEIGMNWNKMQTDENYRKMMHSKRAEAHARERG